MIYFCFSLWSLQCDSFFVYFYHKRTHHRWIKLTLLIWIYAMINFILILILIIIIIIININNNNSYIVL